MRIVSRRWHWLLVAVLLSIRTASIGAQPAAEPLEGAKTLFREGVALLNAGDPEKALEYFLRSRAIVPSGKNTANAAICLDRLGRYDEALELYEELLARFSTDLDQQDREKLAPIMAGLRDRLGRLDISATVEAALVVDSKPRGNLPRTTPLRLLPGQHRVRVVKEGYKTFEQAVDVVAGQTLMLDAELEPLAGFGALRIEQAGGDRARVLIDGKAVGETPWEGTFPAGLHVLQVVGLDRGSEPQAIEVVPRRTLFLRVASRQLGQPLRITAGPRNAVIFLEKTRLGSGEWTGRLPLGDYEFRATAPGYLPARQRFTSSAGASGEAFRITLLPDPALAPKPFPWKFSAGLEGGLAYAPRLNGGHEDACPSRCAQSTSALGGRVEALVDAEHDLGLGARLAFGYAFARQEFARVVFDRVPYDTTYALNQQLALGGPYARAAFRARAPLPWLLELHGDVGAGVLFARYQAAGAGIAWTTGDHVPATIRGLEPIDEIAPIITTGLDLERAFGPLGVWVGVGAWFLPTFGPTFAQSEIVVPPDDCTDAGDVACARPSRSTADERVHGPFFMLTPALGARYHF